MKFTEIEGEIVSADNWSQTHVSGSSTGIAYRGIGASSGRTTSRVTNVSQIWVRTDDGREVGVRTNPDKFAVRAGHRVSMLLANQKKGPAWMVVGVNASTGDTHRETLTWVYFLGTFGALLLCWLPFVALAIHPLLGLVAAAGYLWLVFDMYRSAYRVGRKGASFLARHRETAATGATAPAALEQAA